MFGLTPTFSRRSDHRQPPLPVNRHDFGEFIATSNFFHVWDFLELPSRSSVKEVQAGARRICSFSMGELIGFNAKKASPVRDPKALLEMCFRAAFVTSFLTDGVGFPPDYTVTAVDVINGQKVGWALGSMLYEINTLPWGFTEHSTKKLEKLAPSSKNTSSSSLLLNAQMDRLGGSGEEGSFEFAAGLVLVAVLCIGLIGSLFRRRVSFGRQQILSSSTSEALAIAESETRKHNDYGTRGENQLR